MLRHPSIAPPTPTMEGEKMAKVKLSDIVIGKRFRKDMGDLENLVQSIRERGLLHPIAVTPKMELVCGRRRLEAYKLMGQMHIECNVIDIDDIIKGERDENVCREDFSPSDAVAIAVAIEEREKAEAKERQSEAGKTHGRGQIACGNLPQASKNEKTKSKTKAAKSVGMSRKTLDKAQKVVAAAEEEPERYSDIQEKMDKTGKVDGAYKELKHRKKVEAIASHAPIKPSFDIIHGLMENYIPKIASHSIPLIVTDPPYGLGETANIQFDHRADLAEPKGEWDQSVFYEEWIPLLRSCLRDDGSMYVFVPDFEIGNLWAALLKHGFNVLNLITWHKTNPAPSVRKSCYCHSCEYILFATVGDSHIFNWQGQNEMHNHIEHPICQGNERLDHPTQKPVGLLKRFIEVSSNVGDVVLDPFAGVGSTGAAAKELSRSYKLIEGDENYYRKACIRLQD